MGNRPDQAREPEIEAEKQPLEQEPTRKLGEGSLGAFMRLGLNELRQAVSIEGSVAQPVEMGMFGRPTPSEIAKERDAGGAELYGNSRGQEGLDGMGPSPSEIAAAEGLGESPHSIHGQSPSLPSEIAEMADEMSHERARSEEHHHTRSR